MTLTMYDASVPVFLQGFKALTGVLEKAEAQVTARKFDPAVILASRLYPDMLPFTRQIQIASDGVKGGAARLAGVDVPSYPDTEASFADLHARIAKTVAFVSGVDKSLIVGSEDREITMTIGGKPMVFTGRNYLFGFVLPNFYFHMTTAYAILRHNGIEIGKRDFLGPLS